LRALSSQPESHPVPKQLTRRSRDLKKKRLTDRRIDREGGCPCLKFEVYSPVLGRNGQSRPNPSTLRWHPPCKLVIEARSKRVDLSKEDTLRVCAYWYSNGLESNKCILLRPKRTYDVGVCTKREPSGLRVNDEVRAPRNILTCSVSLTFMMSSKI